MKERTGSTLRALLVASVASAVVTTLAVCSGGGGSEADGGAGGTAGGSEGGSGAVAGSGGGGPAGGIGGGSPGAGGAVAGAGGNPVAQCAALPKLKLTRVAPAEDLVTPVYVIQPLPNEPIYVVRKEGQIVLIKAGGVAAKPFADLGTSVVSEGERGLLGLAFHPEYASNGRFFVYYTRRGSDPHSRGETGDIVIAEGNRSAANKETADPSKYKALVVIGHSEHSNHNGGMISFGPDGLLYAGVGDGGSRDDPYKAGQKPDVPLGKILRINVDQVDARPPGNFPEPADRHVWAIGLRNPWRWSFDRTTGDMYIADVGQGKWEEVSVLPKGTTGANLGWSVMEGSHCFGSNNCDMAGMTKPVAEYAHPPGQNGGQAPGRSITGGFVYRGKAIPCLAGRYLYGDYVSNEIWSFVLQNGKATSPVDLTADLVTAEMRLGGLASFGEDADGELFVADVRGNLYRIQAE